MMISGHGHGHGHGCRCRYERGDEFVDVVTVIYVQVDLYQYMCIHLNGNELNSIILNRIKDRKRRQSNKIMNEPIGM